ncbi:MAG TPA: EI24 domain-containing protein [Burkholderiales bacterium]|nr:EI24 domain-containing protein [Burkholderiales bacterium]
MSIFGSLAYGLANLFHPRMLWLMLWPMLIALIVWGSLALALWARTAFWLAELITRYTANAAAYVNLDVGNIALVLANVLLIFLFIPLVYLTALFILGIFGMNAMVDYVATRSFPGLERRRGGGALGSALNAAGAFLGMLALFLVSVPLWIVPPLWPVIPVLVLAWVNQRLLRYDALAEHADRDELRTLFRERRGALYALGLVMAISAFVPLAGFLVPVAFGLAYIHYLLGALAKLRENRAVLSQP